MSEAMEFKGLKESVAKHGQIEDVIEADVIAKDGSVVNSVVSGFKRKTVISNPKRHNVGRIGLAKYIRLLQDNTPVRMTAREKKLYVATRAREFIGLGMSHKDMMETLKKLTGLSDTRLYSLIPSDLKDPAKQAAGKSASLLKQKRDPDIPKEKTLEDFSKLDIIKYLVNLLDASRMPKYVITDAEKAKLIELRDLITKWCG